MSSFKFNSFSRKDRTHDATLRAMGWTHVLLLQHFTQQLHRVFTPLHAILHAMLHRVSSPLVLFCYFCSKEPITGSKILSPKNITGEVSYALGENVALIGVVRSGTSPVFTWESNGNTLGKDFIVFNSTGEFSNFCFVCLKPSHRKV